MALSKKDVTKLGHALASPAAAKELLACIQARALPSPKTQLALASALCDNLWKKSGTATQEILQAIITGKTLSKKTHRKLVVTFAESELASRLVNLIQTTPSPVLKI